MCDISVAEECTNISVPLHQPIIMPLYKLHNDSADLDHRGTPKKKIRAIFSGTMQIDHLIHMIINYVLRDYIESWFILLSDNKEFSDFRVRKSIEESLQNICLRIKNTQWVPLMTTKCVDNIATHARLYRLATETVNLALDDDAKMTNSKNVDRDSPQRRAGQNAMDQHHRRNSDTDLHRYLNGAGKNGAKFYVDIDRKDNEDKYVDPEMKLVNAFFNHCDSYRDECLNEEALESMIN